MSTVVCALALGHTDDVGGDAANDKLSVARAQSVTHYLQNQGVRSANLSAGRPVVSVSQWRRMSRLMVAHRTDASNFVSETN